MLLSYAHQFGVKVKLISPYIEIQVVEDKLYIEGKKGAIFSLIPIDSTLKGVTLKGFKYSVSSITMYREASRGISNEIVDDLATVEINEGHAFVFVIDPQKKWIEGKY